MDYVGSWRREVFRPLATILIPGGTAIAPLLLVLYAARPEVHGFVELHPTSGAIAVLFTAVVAGFILENFASLLEVYVWDRLILIDTGSLNTDWEAFLLLAWPAGEEPVGHRYLRSLVLRLKFEASFGLSLLLGWLGVLWLGNHSTVFTDEGYILFSFFTLGVAAYLIWESGSTARVLADVRHILLHGKACDRVRYKENSEAARKFDEFVWDVNIFAGIAAVIVILVVIFRAVDVSELAGLSVGVLLLLFFAVQWQVTRPSWLDGRRRQAARRLGIAAVLTACYLALRTWDRDSYVIGWLGIMGSLAYAGLLSVHWRRLGQESLGSKHE